MQHRQNTMLPHTVLVINNSGPILFHLCPQALLQNIIILKQIPDIKLQDISLKDKDS